MQLCKVSLFFLFLFFFFSTNLFSFWYRWELNLRSLIQPSKTLPVDLTETYIPIQLNLLSLFFKPNKPMKKNYPNQACVWPEDAPNFHITLYRRYYYILRKLPSPFNLLSFPAPFPLFYSSFILFSSVLNINECNHSSTLPFIFFCSVLDINKVTFG